MATDAAIGPHRAEGICSRVIVDLGLTDVAMVTRAVECQGRILPVQSRILEARCMPNHALSGRIPLPTPHIVGNRQDLEPAIVQLRQQIAYVLAANEVPDPVYLPSFRSILYDMACMAIVWIRDRKIGNLAYKYRPVLGRKDLAGSGRGVLPQRKTMIRARPELVELLVALAAGIRSILADGLMPRPDLGNGKYYSRRHKGRSKDHPSRPVLIHQADSISARPSLAYL